MATTLAESQSGEDSGKFSSVLDSLPPAIDLPPGEQTPDVTPNTPFCLVCEKEIHRDPGKRGRAPKYHPECRPSALGRVTGSAGTRSKARDAKAASEADECVAMYKALMVKVAVGLSLVDKYDGFVVLAALPEASNNLRGVLIAHEKFRKDFLALKSGGSVVGLVFAHLMMVVPIVAHHGLIPQRHVAELLTNLPITMYRIQQKMKEGEAALTDMMTDFVNGTLARQSPNMRPVPDAAATAQG